MSKWNLNEVYRFQKLAGIEKEDDDLNLSDPPNFTEKIEERLRSALTNAGVDFSKPIFVAEFTRSGDFVYTEKYDSVEKYINYVTSQIKLYGDTVSDLKLNEPDQSIFFKRMRDIPANARGKLSIFLGRSLSRFNTIWQEPGIENEMRESRTIL